MNQEQLFQLYEKLYFLELERREKLSARLNLPLAVLIAVIGFMSFMLNNAPKETHTIEYWLFWVFFSFACISAIIGVWSFKASWFGHTDKLLPTANETENYKQTLIDFYAEYENKEELIEAALKAYLYDYYMKFSSDNTINNDSRAYHLYKATYAITVTALLAVIAFIPYFLNNEQGACNGKQTNVTTTTSAPTPTTTKR